MKSHEKMGYSQCQLLSLISEPSTGQREKKPILLSMKYWLVNRDPCKGLL